LLRPVVRVLLHGSGGEGRGGGDFDELDDVVQLAVGRGAEDVRKLSPKARERID
jgi:hypothetical protein